MLPLHTTFRKLLTGCSFLIILTSCSNSSKTNLEIIKALDESLVHANKILFISTTDYVVSLNDKIYDRSTYLRAGIWYPKAEMIQNLSANIYNFIEGIKIELSEKSSKEYDINTVRKFFDSASPKLYDSLLEYEKRILEVDTLITLEFQKSLLMFTRPFVNNKNDRDDFTKIFFANSSVSAANAVLARLQNNIRIIELNTIKFCHEQCSKVNFGPCSPDLPVVIQSSTIVRPDERIEIRAGICSFYAIIEPEVFVYDKPVPVGTDGIAISRFKADSKPGNIMSR